MEILASCTYNESLMYDGKLFSEDEEFNTDKVSLNVVIDGTEGTISGFNSNVRCLTFIKDVNYSHYRFNRDRMFRLYEYYGDGSLVDFVGSLNLSTSITNVIKLPKTYSNMRDVKTVCINYGVRVIGGNILMLDGVNIGRYNTGKDGGTILYNELYDQFLELPLSEIQNLKEVIKRCKKKLEDKDSSSSSKNAKEKKNISKKVDISKSFSTLFSGVEEEEF